MTPPAILVLWTGYPPGPRTCRSLKRAGFRVVGAFPEDRPGGRSRSCPSPLRYPSPTEQPDRFLETLARICRERSIDAILPLDEDLVRLLAERGDEAGGAAIVGPTAAQYQALCDKLELSRTAQALGIDTPETIVVDGRGPHGDWPALPSIVKPQTSRSEVAKPRGVETADERDEYIDLLVGQGHSVIVQERIDGPRWVVQSARGPGIYEHVAYRVVEEWPRGAGLASMKRPGPPPPGLVEAARALLDSVDYRGPSGISLIERDGRAYPHDVNLRLGATTGVSIHSGFDFPRRAVQAALGLGGTPFSGTWRPGVYMRLDLELQALIDAWRTRDADGRPGRLARRILSVGLNRRGLLDPSPFDPFWAGPLAADIIRRAGRRGAGQIQRRRRQTSSPQGSVHVTR